MVHFLCGNSVYQFLTHLHVYKSILSALLIKSACDGLRAQFLITSEESVRFLLLGSTSIPLLRTRHLFRTNLVYFLVVQANMLEGGGKTPILSPLELEDIGFKIIVYPLSLVGVSIRAMQVCT